MNLKFSQFTDTLSDHFSSATGAVSNAVKGMKGQYQASRTSSHGFYGGQYSPRDSTGVLDASLSAGAGFTKAMPTTSAGIAGAAIGGTAGLMSDDGSMIGGAMMGAAVGAGGYAGVKGAKAFMNKPPHPGTIGPGKGGPL